MIHSTKQTKEDLEIGSKEEQSVFTKEIYKGKKISFVAKFDSDATSKIFWKITMWTSKQKTQLNIFSKRSVDAKRWATNLALYHPYVFICCTKHTPISPATRTIKAQVCSATNLNSFGKKNQKGTNSFIASPVSLLGASATLFSHVYKAPLYFGWDNTGRAGPSAPPNTPVMTRSIVEKVVEREVSIGTIAMPYSCSKV